LDLGCGDGQTSGLWLRDHGCDYVGVDISENAVQAARSLGLESARIDDAASLPFPDASFDAAACIEVLEHLFEPQLAVSEVLRILRPGGVLIVTVPNIAYWRWRLDLALLGRWNPLGDTLAVKEPWRDPHIRFFNPKTLREMLSSAGFNPVKVSGHAGRFLGDLPWLGRRLRGAVGASPPYRTMERLAPSLFAYRLHAVAYKTIAGR
jgi:2-polyprenyl-6-hydroxyphenyl methylase/3-demethylubiquinone-9 3-methyltransferase